MSEGSRVQRWRQQLREQGKKAITVWLTTEEELRLKDLALQSRCSPSAIMQQALAQFSPCPTQDISNGHDTLLIQRLIREELARIQGALLPVTDTVMDTVTVTTPETPAGETSTTPTPTMAHVTDTGNGDVTDTESPAPPLTTPTEDIQAARAYVEHYYGTTGVQEGGTATAPAAARTRRGRQSSPLRQQILALLSEHPEGLSPEHIRVSLNAEKPIGDTLQGMRRAGVVHLRGEGYKKRYFVA